MSPEQQPQRSKIITDPVEPKGFKWHLDPSDSKPILIKPMPIKATLDLFGNGAMVINYQDDMYFPNRWIRFWAKIFFNSKWTLIKDNERNITE